jgi:LuxR family maltose regulon positive regulatory protein
LVVEPGDTRFGVGAVRAGTVRRVGRLPKLSEIDSTVVVLSAPAGYGKTTLIAEWEEIDERPFVCVTASEPDTTGPRLLDSVVQALTTIGAIDPLPFAAAREGNIDALLALLAVSEPSSRSFVLVLDDVHHLSGRDSDTAVHALIDHLPPGSQLVIAGRRCSQFHLGRLRAARELVELGAAALALRDDESAALLHACGVDLSEEAVTTLVEHTEGWPAGLYLASISLEQSDDPVDAAIAFSGHDRFVGEYLRDEVSQDLPDDVREFVEQTSVLERLSGPLCDAVVGRAGSAGVLQHLVASNLMVLPLDAHDDWCRLHRLLREMLSGDLRRRDPALHSALHLRASVWWEEREEYDAAVRHAFEGGDTSRARDLIWKALRSFVVGDQASTLSQWLELFDQSALVADPTLALAVAGYRLANGDPAEVEWWIAVAQESDGSDYLPGGERRDAMLALLNAMVAKDGLHDMREQAGFASRLLPMSSPYRFIACMHEAWALHLQGDHSDARSRWDSLVRKSAARVPQAEAAGEAFFALAAIDDGDWVDAQARIARARLIVRDDPILQGKPAEVLVLAVSAFCHAHASSDATIDFDRARELLPRLIGFEPWAEIVTRCALIRASILVGDLGSARALAAEASGLMDRLSGWDELRPGVASVCAMVDSTVSSPTGGAGSLTSAELRVLRHLPTRLSLGEIAAELFVSRNTVKTQTVAVYRKLDVSSRTEAIDRARELGLVELGSD